MVRTAAHRGPAPSVLVVGGGVAGLSVATALGRRFGRRGAANVTLVDRSFAHVWKPMLHTFAAGTRRSQDEQLPFVHQAARAGFRFLPGPLDGVDSEAGCITVGALTDPGGRPVAPQRRVEYDYLVIAIGSRANDFSIRGVAEHCHFIDDLPAANAFNDPLYGELLQAASYDRRLELAIVGGGATGVELAAEVSQLLDIGRAYGTQNLRPQLGITLIESGSRLLSSFPETISAAAADQLRQIGVRQALALHGVATLYINARRWNAALDALEGSEEKARDDDQLRFAISNDRTRIFNEQLDYDAARVSAERTLAVRRWNRVEQTGDA